MIKDIKISRLNSFPLRHLILIFCFCVLLFKGIGFSKSGLIFDLDSSLQASFKKSSDFGQLKKINPQLVKSKSNSENNGQANTFIFFENDEKDDNETKFLFPKSKSINSIDLSNFNVLNNYYLNSVFKRIYQLLHIHSNFGPIQLFLRIKNFRI